KRHAIGKQDERLPPRLLFHHALSGFSNRAVDERGVLARNRQSLKSVCQLGSRRCEVLQYLHALIEVSYESAILLGTQHPFQKCPARAALRFEHSDLASARIHQQSDREWKTALPRKIADLLRNAILQKNEIVRVEVFIESAVFVSNCRQNRDHVDTCRKGGLVQTCLVLSPRPGEQYQQQTAPRDLHITMFRTARAGPRRWPERRPSWLRKECPHS